MSGSTAATASDDDSLYTTEVEDDDSSSDNEVYLEGDGVAIMTPQMAQKVPSSWAAEKSHWMNVEKVEAAWEKMAQLLFSLDVRNVTRLEIDGEKGDFCAEGLAMLEEAVSKNKTVHELELRGPGSLGGDDSPRGVVAICRALQKNKTIKHFILDNDQCNIGESKAMGKFAQVISENRLESLYLKYYVDCRHVEVVMASLAALMAALATNTSLRIVEIALNNNYCGNGQQNGGGDDCTSSKCWTAELMRSLAAVLTTNTTLLALRLALIDEAKMERDVLSWSDCGCGNSEAGEAAMVAVARALESNNTLLHFVGYITGAAGSAYAHALERNTTLAELKIVGAIKDMDGLVHLAEALEKNTSLRSLDLEYVSYEAKNDGDAGVIALAKALQVNATLKSISLWDFPWNFKHIPIYTYTEMRPEDRASRLLEQLDVRKSDLAMSNALKSNRSLKLIDLGSDAYSFEDEDLYKYVETRQLLLGNRTARCMVLPKSWWSRLHLFIRHGELWANKALLEARGGAAANILEDFGKYAIPCYLTEIPEIVDILRRNKGIHCLAMIFYSICSKLRLSIPDIRRRYNNNNNNNNNNQNSAPPPKRRRVAAQSIPLACKALWQHGAEEGSGRALMYDVAETLFIQRAVPLLRRLDAMTVAGEGVDHVDFYLGFFDRQERWRLFDDAVKSDVAERARKCHYRSEFEDYVHDVRFG